MSENIQNSAWWVSTKEFLPDMNERVLCITKFGHVVRYMFTDNGMGRAPLFEPDGMKPGDDVKWWMPIPKDGWKKLEDEMPAEGQEVLAMGLYGEIFSAKCRRFLPHMKPELAPAVGYKYIFWRPMPELPTGVSLNY